ncbi:MAG: hypothetical protein AB1815_07745 [Bacillota bacterium]
MFIRLKYGVNRKTGYYQLEGRYRECGKVKYIHIAYLGAKPTEKPQSFIDSGRFIEEEVSRISYKAEDFSLEGRVLKVFLSNLRERRKFYSECGAID